MVIEYELCKHDVADPAAIGNALAGKNRLAMFVSGIIAQGIGGGLLYSALRLLLSSTGTLQEMLRRKPDPHSFSGANADCIPMLTWILFAITLDVLLQLA